MTHRHTQKREQQKSIAALLARLFCVFEYFTDKTILFGVDSNSNSNCNPLPDVSNMVDHHPRARILAQEVHRHTTIFTETLHAATTVTGTTKPLSMHHLRRPLRNLDRSLGNLQALVVSTTSTSTSSSSLVSPNPPHHQQATLGTTGLPVMESPKETSFSYDEDPSIRLGNQRMHSQSQHVDVMYRHPDQQQQGDDSEAVSNNDHYYSSNSFEHYHNQLRQDLWTILHCLPVWPNQDICVSILRRTVLLWEHLATAVEEHHEVSATHMNDDDDKDTTPIMAVKTLLQLILQTPDCLFSVYGIAWVRIANQVHRRQQQRQQQGQTAACMEPHWAWRILHFVLPIVREELSSRMDTTTTTTTTMTLIDDQTTTSTRFLQGLIQMLEWVTRDLIMAHKTAASSSSTTMLSFEEWLMNLTTIVLPGSRNVPVAQIVAQFMDQLVDYTNLLVDFAQDELDKATGSSSSSWHTHENSVVYGYHRHHSSSDNLTVAIDLILLAFLQVEHLPASHIQHNDAPLASSVMPTMATTNPDGLSHHRHHSLRTLWQTLATADVPSNHPVYESSFLPTLLRLTQTVLNTLPVELELFVPVWLRVLPLPSLWVEVEEIWWYLEHALTTATTSSSTPDGKDERPALRRLIQLVLLTLSPPTCTADAQVCLRLQALLTMAENEAPPQDASMADLYFIGNYTPVDPNIM